jgi:hypothetical protein
LHLGIFYSKVISSSLVGGGGGGGGAREGCGEGGEGWLRGGGGGWCAAQALVAFSYENEVVACGIDTGM